MAAGMGGLEELDLEDQNLKELKLKVLNLKKKGLYKQEDKNLVELDVEEILEIIMKLSKQRKRQLCKSESLEQRNREFDDTECKKDKVEEEKFKNWLNQVSRCLKGRGQITASRRKEEDSKEQKEEEKEEETEEERCMRVVRSVLDEHTVLDMVTAFLEMTKVRPDHPFSLCHYDQDVDVPDWAEVTFKGCKFDRITGKKV